MNITEYARMYEAEDTHWWYVGLHRLISEIVRKEAKKAGRPLRIFDAGCGTGRLCELLSRFGIVEGCDISEVAIEKCRLRGILSLHQADLNRIELATERYDIITSMDVLCQLAIPDDMAVLKMFYRALRPGGALMINLPAYEFLRSTHDAAVHVRERYTRKAVAGRLEKAGFEIDFITYRVSVLFPAIAAYRLLFRKRQENDGNPEKAESDVKLSPPLINDILKFVMYLENHMLLKHALPWGTSVFAVARRA